MTSFAELSPASDWCQRWDERSHSWRHKHEGGFDAALYTVEAIDELTAKNYVTRHHYSGSYPAASMRWGLFKTGVLVGVAVLSVPVQTKVLTSVFPDLEPFVSSLELGRFVLNNDDDAPGNSESWFLGRVFTEAAAAGIRGIVSFADPVPRQTPSGLVIAGHVGTIYQATNAVFTGRATPRSLTLLPSGEAYSDRAKQKIRSQSRGHRHAEEKLIGLGARPMRAGEKPATWLAEALQDVGARRIRHRGNFRYAFTLGTTRRQRRNVVIALPTEPYPKHPDLLETA